MRDMFPFQPYNSLFFEFLCPILETPVDFEG